jgi:hypothetical protein
MKNIKEYLKENYSVEKLANFISDFTDEQTNYGTSDLDEEDVKITAEVVIEGDDELSTTIIKLVKSVKNKKDAVNWFVKEVMKNSGNEVNQKEILKRLRKSL